MIRVTQGHEKGIGLEVLIKSLLLLDQDQLNQIALYCFEEPLMMTLKTLGIPYSIANSKLNIFSKKVSCNIQTDDSLPQTSVCLEAATADIPPSDILFTLPSSKDQIICNGKKTSGHTEYLRKKYNNHALGMMFEGPRTKVLLLTDHIALKKVPTELTPEYIVKKISIALNQLPDIKELYFAGINPHAGEDGLIGDEDQHVAKAMAELRTKFPNYKMNGPFPGDTLHNYEVNLEQLFIYCYHDQALAKFKAQNEFFGLNITLGLPYLRASVDHGTAFDLYGKSKANYMGCYWGLLKLLNW